MPSIGHEGPSQPTESVRAPQSVPPQLRGWRYKGQGGAAFLLTFLCVVTVLGADPQAALQRHLQQAQIHLDQGEYSPAVEELEKAIQIQAEIPGAYYQLGLAHWNLQNLGEAKKAFQGELRFDPPDAHSLYYLGRIHLSRGEIDEAIQYFERVLAIGTVLDVRTRLAGSYLNRDQIEKAVELLEDTVRTRPEQGDVHYLLARAYQKQGRKEDALREFDLAQRWKNKVQDDIRTLIRLRIALTNKDQAEAFALARDLRVGGDPDVMLGAGIALGQSGYHHDALLMLERVVETRPTYAEAFYNMALARVSLGQPTQAIPLLRKAIELRPEFYEALVLLGNQLVASGRGEEAIRYLRSAAGIRRDNSRLPALLGTLYLQQRYYDEAIESRRLAVELEPSKSELRFLLVDALHRNHDFEKALAQARQILMDFPELPRSFFLMAAQLDNMGRFSEAREPLERAVEMDSRFFEARLLLGEVLLKLGETEASLDHFRAVRSQDPKLIHAHAGLGKALIQLKRHEEVTREMEKALRIDSELASLHLYLSQAYRALGRMEEAKREAAVFTRLNRERARKRDRDVKRTYSE